MERDMSTPVPYFSLDEKKFKSDMTKNKVHVTTVKTCLLNI